MSIDMDLSASRAQASSFKRMAAQKKQGYDEMERAINQFALNSPMLTGAAYDAAKRHYTNVLIPLVKGGRLLTEAAERAVQKFPEEYVSQVDSVSLKESKLTEQINRLQKKIEAKKAQQSQLRQLASQLPSEERVSARKAQQGLSNSIAALEKAKKKLEKKREKLRAFHRSSPAIFSEIAALEAAINKGATVSANAWNGSTFVAPSKVEMKWAKEINKQYLDNEMNKVLLAIPDLTSNMLNTLLEYAKNYPYKEIPEKLKKYLIKNKDDILFDLKNDVISNFIEQLGLQTTKFGGILTALQGIAGPNVNNSFILVNPNGIGASWLKYGKNISTVGKFLGWGFMLGGFTVGMNDDIKNNDKTIGQALTHNGTGSALALGTGLLISNPGGWAVLGGIALGTIVGVGFEFAYDNNFLGIQDGLDWVGDKVDDGFDWMNDKVKDIGEALNDIGDSINPMNWGW